MSEDSYRAEKIGDMRLALDYLEAVPGIPLPYFGTLNAYCDKTHDIGVMARVMKPVEKVNSTYYFSLRRKFGSIILDVSFEHEQVCEKVVISTEEVPARLVEAYTREVIEWKCPESLLNGDTETGFDGFEPIEDENPADVLDEDAPVEPVETYELTDDEGDETLDAEVTV